MIAHAITIFRVILCFAVIALFHAGIWGCLAAVALTVVVIYLDSLDGIVARRLGLSSDFGALFDIAGDRIVEHVYWIYFSVAGLVSMWVPVIIITRSFLVDSIRAAAFSAEGKTPFGDKSMMRSPLTRFLTASRFSRGLYGATKISAFLLLGLAVTFSQPDALQLPWIDGATTANTLFLSTILVWINVAMNLLRGIPVLWDGRAMLRPGGMSPATAAEPAVD